MADPPKYRRVVKLVGNFTAPAGGECSCPGVIDTRGLGVKVRSANVMYR